MATIDQKIAPCLWFDNQAEEAAKFYTSIFKNSKVKDVFHYDDSMSNPSNLPPGSVMLVTFDLEGQEFSALNGGPIFKFTEAISFVIKCKDQEEVDYFWDKLLEGGEPSVCGWLKDKYGLSWQVTPVEFLEMYKSKDEKKVRAATQAMLKMTKLDMNKLREAFDNA